MRIRGTFLKDYVKIVQETPELDWNKFLTAEDWAIARALVVPTEWYPAETMAHIGRGLFEMRSQRNYAAVRVHGRMRVDTSYDDATKKFLLKDNPRASLSAYAGIARRYIDDLNIALEKSAPGRADVCFYPVDGIPAWDLFREIQAGTLERLVELNGGINPRAELIAETRQGREACIMRLTWGAK